MATVQDLFIPGKAGKLAVRAKGLTEKPQKVVVMVQGSNATGQTMLDFSYPGGKDYSLMDAMVAAGFGAVTFSIRGYGKSDAPEDPFSVTTETAMEDLNAVVDWVVAQGFARPHLFGFSWGGRIVGRYAEDHADKIDRLVLLTAARGGGGLVLPAPTDPWWQNNAEFYYERFEPEFTEPEFRRAFGDYIVSYEPRSPNGIRRENASYVTPIDPTKLTCPVITIYGALGAKAIYMQGGMSRGEFFELIPAQDKAYVILPDSGDFPQFQGVRYRLHKTITDFLHAR